MYLAGKKNGLLIKLNDEKPNFKTTNMNDALLRLIVL